MRRALLLTLLLFTVPATAHAQSLDRSDRTSAKEALEQVEQLIDGRGVRDKRQVTLALAELARSRADLGTTDRARAARILARPPDSGNQLGKWTAPSGDQRSFCSAHFCVRWVTTTNDAPNLADSDTPPDGVPDYVEFMSAMFEQSYTTEIGALGWRMPLDDNKPTAAEDLVDVYISDIGNQAYGFAVPEGSSRSVPSYLVMDDDYSSAQFPSYGGNPTIPVQATAAHEFNHVLQFAYDAVQDFWMAESTATWAEEKVFAAANDYVFYLKSWAARPDVPITSAGDGDPPDSDDLKMYGSAIWNRWLDDRFGAATVREAWARSQANSVSGGGFAPVAYDRAIRDVGGGDGFSAELARFTAATAEWDATDSGIHEGATFLDEVARIGTLTPGGAPVGGAVDHTAFAFYDVPVPAGADQLNLTGGLPAGTAGAIALVGLAGSSQTRVVGLLDADGRITVSLPDPGRFSRITAVVVNTDTSTSGFSGVTEDWIWTKDAQTYSLTATTGAAPVEPTPTASPSATPTATVTPTPTPTPRTTVGLTRSSTRLATITRKGVLSFFARTNKAGRLTAKATVDRATAVRLKVGRRTTSAGTAQRTFRSPARLKINIRLTRKVRAALKRVHGKAVTVKIAVAFTPNDGSGTVRRTFTLRLRR